MCYINSTTLRTVTFFVFFHFSFVFISCSDSGTEPPPKPPGYQEDIPWPSLADSPWPMYRHDPQNSGRTDYIGPMLGEIEWTMDSVYVGSGAVVDEDSTIYFVSTRIISQKIPDEAGLIALKGNGDIKWIFPITKTTAYEASTPIISASGQIYFTSPIDRNLYSLNKSGELMWILSDINVNAPCLSIGKNGTLYLLEDQNNLYAIDALGKVLWKMTDPDFYSSSYRSMAFSPDGSTLYLPGRFETAAIVAVDVISQTVKWKFGKIPGLTPIVVDFDGNVYFIADNEKNESSLFSLNDKGYINWEFEIKDHSRRAPWGYQLLTIDKYGNLFTGYDTVYCIDYKGQLMWKYGLDLDNNFISTPGSIDVMNNLYIDSRQNYTFSVIKLDNDGIEIFNRIYPYSARTGYSFVIGYNEYLYLPSWESFGISSIK